jgi:hypothetical protein
MSKTATYSLIASTTVGTATASVTLSSIPATYTDIILVCNYGLSADADSRFIVNGDSTSGLYSYTNLRGNGTAAATGRASALNYIQFGLGGVTVPTTLTSTAILFFNDYSNTATFKTVLTRVGDAAAQVLATAGLWRNTNAITSITLNAISANFLTNSTFKLYGIQAGNA